MSETGRRRDNKNVRRRALWHPPGGYCPREALFSPGRTDQ